MKVSTGAAMARPNELPDAPIELGIARSAGLNHLWRWWCIRDAVGPSEAPRMIRDSSNVL